jgi:hypothetical protein
MPFLREGDWNLAHVRIVPSRERETLDLTGDRVESRPGKH